MKNLVDMGLKNRNPYKIPNEYSMINWKKYYGPNFVYHNDMSNKNCNVFNSHMLATSKCPRSVDCIFISVINAKEVSDMSQKDCCTLIRIKIFIF